MIKFLGIKKALSLKNSVFVDVRSPKEFAEDTIPNSINLPILYDDEREKIGYIYKQIDVNKAKEEGLKYASHKLLNFYKTIKELIEDEKEVVLFCYRGGMRSQSVAKVLDIMDLNINILEGGYKSYRRYIKERLNTFENKYNYIVLHGYTGVGKTKILNTLDIKGMSVIDLEGLAKNSGSVFGSLFYNTFPNSQKKFESLLFEKLSKFDSRLIFTESESRRVGNSILPGFLFENMKTGYHVLIKTNINNRISNILEDYGENKLPDKTDKLINAINKLRKKLGNNKTDDLINKVNDGDYGSVINILMTDYYDPLYDFSINKYSYDLVIDYKDIDEAVYKLINFVKDLE